MRLAQLRIEILDDAAGKPYVLIEGWPETPEAEFPTPAGMRIAVWADKVTVGDSRKEKS